MVLNVLQGIATGRCGGEAGPIDGAMRGQWRGEDVVSRNGEVRALKQKVVSSRTRRSARGETLMGCCC